MAIVEADDLVEVRQQRGVPSRPVGPDRQPLDMEWLGSERLGQLRQLDRLDVVDVDQVGLLTSEVADRRHIAGLIGHEDDRELLPFPGGTFESEELRQSALGRDEDPAGLDLVVELVAIGLARLDVGADVPQAIAAGAGGLDLARLLTAEGHFGGRTAVDAAVVFKLLVPGVPLWEVRDPPLEATG